MEFTHPSRTPPRSAWLPIWQSLYRWNLWLFTCPHLPHTITSLHTSSWIELCLSHSQHGLTQPSLQLNERLLRQHFTGLKTHIIFPSKHIILDFILHRTCAYLSNPCECLYKSYKLFPIILSLLKTPKHKHLPPANPLKIPSLKTLNSPTIMTISRTL